MPLITRAFWLGLLVLAPFNPVASGTARSATAPTTNPVTATDAARHYMDLFRSGNVEKAINHYVAVDRSLHLAFGDDLRDYDEKEIAETAALIRDNLFRLLGQPRLLEFYRQMVNENFAEEVRDDGRTVVTFDTRFGGRRQQNTYVMEQLEGRWRIADQGRSMDGAATLMTTDHLRRAYEQTDQRMKLLAFVRDGFRSLERSTSQVTTRPAK